MNYTVLSEKEARAKLDTAREAGQKTFAETMQIVADLTDSNLNEVSRWYYDPAGTTKPAKAFDASIIQLAAAEYAKSIINNIEPQGATIDRTHAASLIAKGILSNNNDIISALDYLAFSKSDEIDDIERQIDELKKRHAEACRIYTNANEIAEAYKEELENE